jgi:hypothetical protein
VTGEPDPRDRLTGPQVHLMFAVVRGEGDVSRIGARFGLAPIRVRRWLASPRFRQALIAQRRAPWPDPTEESRKRLREALTSFMDARSERHRHDRPSNRGKEEGVRNAR